jgi:cytoskeletal protein RodZ
MGLEHIGQKLKSARDGLGLSLSQIHERTKIPFNHLQSIDNGNDEDLPEPVYVSGFIKRYAECVGLNGQQLVEEYREDLEEGNANNSNGNFGFTPQRMKEQQLVAPPPTNYFNKNRIEQPPPNLFKLILFPAFFVVLALFLTIFLANRQQSAEVAQDPSLIPLKDTAKFTGLPTPPPAESAPPAAQTPIATATPAVPPTPVAPPSNEARVTLTGLRRVWIEVKSESSGETKFNGFLDTGDRRDFQDSEGLRVIAGSGGNLSVEANGKTETFGAAGKRTERVFMSKNAAAAQKTAEAETGKTTTASTSATATPAKKPTPPKKNIASAKKRVDNLPSREYMPGESLGSGSKAIDVPYRY